jgi:hypothetical protein
VLLPTASRTSCARWRCRTRSPSGRSQRCARGWSRSAPGPCVTGEYVVLQLVEVAVPRALFAAILRRIDRLRGPPLPAP